jgi:hypothetical protein
LTGKLKKVVFDLQPHANPAHKEVLHKVQQHGLVAHAIGA